MKIAIATVQVPFIRGGAEILTELLKDELLKRKYHADIVTIPFKWYPTEALVNTMLMGRMLDLSEVNSEKIDMVIAMKFPAYYVKHDNKVMWLMHQHRQAYDLWATAYGDLDKLPEGGNIRQLIIENDNTYINEAKKNFTIAQNTSNRLKKYNNISSTALYHPPKNYEKLHCTGYEDFIFYPSRIDAMKRQRVVVEAAKHLQTTTKIYIAGSGSEKEIAHLESIITNNNLQDKVRLLGFISEEEKIDYYARCLAVYFGAYDEDYGYITLEAFFAKKPVLVHHDAGGPLEFVIDNNNGFITDADPKKVAHKIDALARNRDYAKQLGEAGFNSLQEKNMNWDYVIENLVK